MAQLNILKSDLKRMVEVLAANHATMDDAAKAVLEEAFAIYEAKAKFVVAGQVRYSKGYVSPEDGRASKVMLGPYATLKQAQNAGESLAYAASTQEELRWWALPIEHGTGSQWHMQRKKAREAAELEAKATATTSQMTPEKIRARDAERLAKQEETAA